MNDVDLHFDPAHFLAPDGERAVVVPQYAAQIPAVGNIPIPMLRVFFSPQPVVPSNAKLVARFTLN